MKKEMIKKIGVIGIVVCMGVILLTGCSSMQRDIKSTTSDFSGGLNRHIQVYSDNGTLISEYNGKCDIEDTEYGNKVLFDLNGKRTIIYNATVIIQEI